MPQFMKSNKNHVLQSQSAQALFGLFREAGPIVSIRRKVNLGLTHPTVVVEYWQKKPAMRAQGTLLRQSGTQPATLHFFDPCALFCAVCH